MMIRLLALLLVGLLWFPLLVLASYESYAPSILGRWSFRFFMVMLAYVVVVLPMTVVLGFRLQRRGRVADLLRHSLNWLRERTWCCLFALLFPVVVWLLLAVAAAVVQPGPALYYRFLLLWLDLGLVVIAFTATLLFFGRTRRQQRLTAMKCAALLIGILAGLSAAEISINALGLVPVLDSRINPQNIHAQFRTDEFDTWVTTNAQSLRGTQDHDLRRVDVYRVAVVGDSMTFGHGVNDHETYVEIAERRLRDQGQANVELINVSRNGAGPADYLNFIRRYVARWKPKLVVVSFYTGNDCPVFQPLRLQSRRQLQSQHDLIVFQSHGTALNHSSLFRLFDNGVIRPFRYYWRDRPVVSARGIPDPITNGPNILGQFLAAEPQSEELRRRREMLDKLGWIEKGLKGEVNPGLIVAILKRPNAVADSMFLRAETRAAMSDEWELCRSVLSEIHKATVQMGAQLIVLVIPQAYQVDPASLAQLEAFGCYSTPDMLDNRELNDRLAEFCQNHRVRCVDPLELFRLRTQSGERLYFPIDTHLTPTGHQLLGETLSNVLTELLPK